MSFRQQFLYCLDQLRNHPSMDWIEDVDIQIGDRKHQDEMRPYEMRLAPRYEYEKDHTQDHWIENTETGEPQRSGTKLMTWGINLDLYCNFATPEERLLGDEHGRPGCMDAVALTKAALVAEWDAAGGNRESLTFTNVEYVESYPPYKVLFSIAITEEVSIHDAAQQGLMPLPARQQPADPLQPDGDLA